MAKGYELNKKRQDELSILGRGLARRSGSKCELCMAAGNRLNVFEIPPVSGEPDPDKCVFICDTCLSGILEPTKFEDHWRCLHERIWSETRPVKVISVIMLKKISDKNSWAGDILDEVYLDDEESGWIEASGL